MKEDKLAGQFKQFYSNKPVHELFYYKQELQEKLVLLRYKLKASNLHRENNFRIEDSIDKAKLEVTIIDTLIAKHKSEHINDDKHIKEAIIAELLEQTMPINMSFVNYIAQSCYLKNVHKERNVSPLPWQRYPLSSIAKFRKNWRQRLILELSKSLSIVR